MLPPLAHLETGEALDDDPLAGLGVHPVDELADLRLAGGVLDERLLEQTLIGEEFLELTLDDLVEHLSRFFLVGQLLAIDLALLFDHRAGNVFPGDVRRVRRRDLHPELLHELLEGIGSRDEVGLAIHLDQHPELGTVVDVRPDGALAGFAVRALACLGEPLLSKELDGGLQITVGRLERLLAVHHPGAGPIAEVLHQLRGRRHPLVLRLGCGQLRTLDRRLRSRRLALVLAECPAALVDGVGDARRDQTHRPDRVVVARDRIVDAGRIAIGVHDRDDRDAQALGLGHRDLLLARIDDEDRRRELVHHLDADQRLLELLALPIELERFLFGHPFVLPRLLHFLELLEPGDRLANRREVRQGPAEPALVDVEHAAAAGFLEHGLLGLLLGADEEHCPAARGQVTDEPVGLAELLECLLKVDDVNAVALAEDVLLHLRVPALGLMAEVHSGLEQLLHRQRGHGSSFGLPPPRSAGPPGGRKPCHRKRAACVMVSYVVYLALSRTYSSLRSHVQTRSSPRPSPRSIEISYSDNPMISRMRSIRTPSFCIPRSTSRSSPNAIATFPGSIRAGDLPRAIMIRPQLGSWPLMAVLTSGEFATARAACRASLPLAAPRTATVTSFVAPSASATSMRASFVITASRP